MNPFLIASFESALSQGMRDIALLTFALAFIMIVSAGWQWRNGRPDEAKSALLGAVVMALASAKSSDGYSKINKTDRVVVNALTSSSEVFDGRVGFLGRFLQKRREERVPRLESAIGERLVQNHPLYSIDLATFCNLSLQF